MNKPMAAIGMGEKSKNMADGSYSHQYPAVPLSTTRAGQSKKTLVEFSALPVNQQIP